MTHGTTPEGTRSEQEAALFVRDMFGRAAPNYDLLNRVLSLSLDRGWRSYTVRQLRPVLDNPASKTLDLCCGTGDLLASLTHASKGFVAGLDFAHAMLVRSRNKSEAPLIEADALQIPVRDESFDALTVAFGFRNYANYRAGLIEMRRVLRPGGMVAILELSTPRLPFILPLYRIYASGLLPVIGRLLSAAPDSYRYLPASIEKFLTPEQLADLMRECGFREVRFKRLTFGVVALHLGVR